MGSTARGQNINREYTLKSAYLYRFATYITFPATAFQTLDSPFVIGVLGPDPLGNDFKKIARVKKIGNRTIVIRNYRSATEIKECHILFMSRELPIEEQVAALKLLAGRNILFVGDTPNFLTDGGVICFVVVQNKIQIHICTSAYKREKLEVSSKLLRISTILP